MTQALLWNRRSRTGNVKRKPKNIVSRVRIVMYQSGADESVVVVKSL
ncbi:MAG: hypothetical protein GX685_05045 [Clostridiales bacterium]|nr:hypothetical protein [Clostridiales bacterium]